MSKTVANMETSEKWEAHAQLVLSELNEKHRRWVAGLLSEALGWGGTKRVASVTGIDPKTIRQGRIELKNRLEGQQGNQVRSPGAGRPSLKKRP